MSLVDVHQMDNSKLKRRYRSEADMNEVGDAITCFKIKNPPTVHSTSKIQPKTPPTFVFSVSASASVKKKVGLCEKTVGQSFWS
jgi:hypothetical protein